MDNNNEAIQLLDILYGMIADAWEVPMNKDKCIIEREKALDIISKVKIILPTELTEAKRLVSTRNEFILNTRKEAEAIKKNAQETQRRLLDEQQIIKTANERAAAILSERFAAASSAMQLVHEASQEEEKNEDLFYLLYYTLTFLAYGEAAPQDLFLCFLSKYLDVIGYRPVLTSCVQCGKDLRPEKEVFYSGSEIWCCDF